MPKMKSLGFQNILIFVVCAGALGVALSCPDNINRGSSKNSNDQSRLYRLNKKISNDNNLARDISRNNNLAPGVSIIGNNGGLKIDRKAETTEKLVNSWKEKHYYTNHAANYPTNKERISRRDSSPTLQVGTYSKTNAKKQIHTNSYFKPKQFGNKFSKEIDDFSNNLKVISRNDKLSFTRKEQGDIKQIEGPKTKKQFITTNDESPENLNSLSTIQNQYMGDDHHLHRREVDITESYTPVKNRTNMKEIKIAALLPSNDSHPFSIQRVRPAIEIAIDKMNPLIAHHNRYLSVRFRDSKCDIADGINECINFYVNKEMHVLFGPCCDYTVAPCARQVVYWNIPMITAGGLAGDFGIGKAKMYSMMTRIGSNFNTLVNFFADVFMYYNWRKLFLVYDPYGQINISSKFCHIIVNDIHYGIREEHKSRNITQDYIKFEFPDKSPKNSEFKSKIGLDYSGKT